MNYHYAVSGNDYASAGTASSEMKKILISLGIPNDIIKRTAIAMYEAEINMVVHGGGGEADININETCITIVMKDTGPGIEDINLAMQDGYSTASQQIRELGFGAGMGLSNMKRTSDEMQIDSGPGKGTKVTMKIHIPEAV